MAAPVVSTTAITVVVIKAVASHAVLVIAAQTVVDMLIVRLHAADSASVQVALVAIAPALVNAQAAALPIVAHHVGVRLATVLTAHRVTTVLLIVKRSKMHAMTHAASLHQYRTAS